MKIIYWIIIKKIFVMQILLNNMLKTRYININILMKTNTIKKFIKIWIKKITSHIINFK